MVSFKKSMLSGIAVWSQSLSHITISPLSVANAARNSAISLYYRQGYYSRYSGSLPVLIFMDPQECRDKGKRKDNAEGYTDRSNLAHGGKAFV